MRKRKNYPGELREIGTKDYSLILGNLMNYRNQLMRETEEQKMGLIFSKVSEKLKEIGCLRASNSVKNRAGRKKLGLYQEITSKKKEEVIEIINKNWHEAKQKHDAIKTRNKKFALDKQNIETVDV
ncbi:hypothetical protein EI427_06145 [Flammeovirga pectinis]|uniref:Uncharacterized protein n=1 Tax=Flammeovirga pectinis TaxID=2494373 RepID=A0A3Q9FJY4_9BACT|nr:hypothetical protein [Flammeovirga pectinis]AZQ61831.1 hypothetical protein EI427_06145 [Flammeovirga pectinis]